MKNFARDLGVIHTFKNCSAVIGKLPGRVLEAASAVLCSAGILNLIGPISVIRPDSKNYSTVIWKTFSRLESHSAVVWKLLGRDLEVNLSDFEVIRPIWKLSGRELEIIRPFSENCLAVIWKLYGRVLGVAPAVLWKSIVQDVKIIRRDFKYMDKRIVK